MTSPVLDGITLLGAVNTDHDAVLDQIAQNIRRGYPQVRPQAIQPDDVCIVGSGPSLADTEAELVDLVMRGAKVVALNGAADWCMARHIRPSAHVLLDARPENARFVGPPIPQCRYLLASQCHPDTFDAVADRDVWIWHAVGEDEATTALLNDYYLTHWHGVVGGTTVAMRAIPLVRMLGYLRMHLFGVDSCWMDGQHHAFPQTENDRDKAYRVVLEPSDGTGPPRTFTCAPWHLKQLEDFLQLVRVNGHLFKVRIYGDGMLAYALQTSALITTVEAQEKD